MLRNLKLRILYLWYYGFKDQYKIDSIRWNQRVEMYRGNEWQLKFHVPDWWPRI